MPRSTSPKLVVSRLLADSPAPVYVLDHEGRLVFLNAACAHWLGVEEHELLGVVCKYVAESDLPKISALAAGLAPPPDRVAQLIPFSSPVAFCNSQGHLSRREAWFSPVPPASDARDNPPWHWIVIVGNEVTTPALPAPWDTTCAALHDRLRALSAGRYALGSLVGDSPAMEKVRRQAELAVRAESGALISGPPGSGREHVARAIHHAQEKIRGRGLLLPLDGALQSAELMQATLVAFARRCRELKGGVGSLLLLDVDQLPLDAQLELEAWHQLPGQEIRLYATAESDLSAPREGRSFRPALAARLNTLCIVIPSLVDRRSDIPSLAQHFVERENLRRTKQLAGFTTEAMELLLAYAWPGELQQMADFVSQAARRCERDKIDVADLPNHIHQAMSADKYAIPQAESLILDDFLAQIESELMRRALGQAKGNKTKAAELLGISRPRLLRRLVQLGLAPPGADPTDDETPIFEQV